MEDSQQYTDSASKESKLYSGVKTVLKTVGSIVVAVILFVVATWVCTVIGFHPGPRSGLGTPIWFLGGASPYELIVNFMGW